MCVLEPRAAARVSPNCSAIAGKEAEVDKRDGDGRTALHWAAAGGKDDVVEFLLSREASVNTHDDVCL